MEMQHCNAAGYAVLALLFSQLEGSAPLFSDNHKGLINLFETLLFTHQPIWYHIQQLMRMLFKTEEWKRIIQEARKNVPSDAGAPSMDQAVI